MSKIMQSSRSLDKSYKNAISLLNSRRRPGRPSNVSTSSSQNPPNVKGTPDLRGTPSLVGMKQWLHRIGHSTADIDRLNVVHVAGTKGKGSTCAFVESFLRAFGQRTGFPRKTGLYTSPHLIYPEERIRINFKPIERDLFAKYFFEVWDALSENESSQQGMPRYLQLVALVSFHAFVKEGVEAAIVETHHGGEYDATNVIEHPVATVICPLGMDHVKQLGPTIENIAWHKAGILKSGSRAFSAPQEASAAEMIRSRASEKGTDVQFIEEDPSLPKDAPQLKPDVQRKNCSLAIATARSFLEEKAPKEAASLSSTDIRGAISQFSWPGRFQLISEGTFEWFLDGAHNEMSVTKAAEWFIESLQPQRAPVLIFGQVSKQRDTEVVVEHLATAFKNVENLDVIFTLYDPNQDFDDPKDLIEDSEHASLEALGAAWKKIHPNSRVSHEPNVQKAMDSARRIGAGSEGTQALITGSQHLVGSAIFSLNNRASN